MSTTLRLNPPKLDNIIPAQMNNREIYIPFTFNRSVGWSDFIKICAIIKTPQTNTHLATCYCTKESLEIKNNDYIAIFRKSGGFNFQEGQYYKIQLAYQANDGTIGFYSSAATFKFTAKPAVTIENLQLNEINSHTFDYTGKYSNTNDPSEKVYSYCFELYDRANNLLASSGEMLHNASKDTETTSSTDSWTTRKSLTPGLEYTIVYKVKTNNGLELTSPSYKIIDGQTVPSNLFKYYDFLAINNSESACVELALQPKRDESLQNRKLINGKFVLTRASSEDNFQSWHEMTRFILASWDSSRDKFICKDYSVSQGVTYIYGLQAYNNNGVYSKREEAKSVQVDFEDMFLSDGQRQLRIKFNPKVSSFKTTLLESKMDTLGGKYPFFFRNGNVCYKEFPISGMISLLMDEHEEFISGIKPKDFLRQTTPAPSTHYKDLITNLSGENFKNERNFKMEVLNWLTNGKPKLFRSPGEGSYIVRLMNTSLSPNDTLSRMLHTFSSTAYEMADFNFENLRKYGMLMDEYLETREIRTFTKNLFTEPDGKLEGLNACLAILHAKPGTVFKFRLKESAVDETIIVGPTGVYNFSSDVLQETPLMDIYHPDKEEGWFPEATLIYSTFINPNLDSFSYIQSIQIEDKIAQWIGNNESEVEKRFDPHKLKKSLGLIYYINLQKRDITFVDEVIPKTGFRNDFKIKDIVHYPSATEILYCPSTGEYFDGRTTKKMQSGVNYKVQLRRGDQEIDLMGTGSLPAPYDKCEGVTSTGGRIVLTNLSDIDYLKLGNGVYIDIAYQEILTTYTVETTNGLLKAAKDKWLQTKKDEDYQSFYNLLERLVEEEESGLIVDGI